MKTLSQILIEVNAVLDLDASSPTGTELTTRANYANQAIWDAAAMGQLREFKREFLTTAGSMATISLPTDFREFQEWPRIATSGGWQEYEPIDIGQKYQRSGDYVVYVEGNPVDGYSAVFENIISSATLSIIYQRYPSGLLTLTDVCEVPDPQYVAKQIQSYVLYSRSDDRFPIADQRAQQSMANMMGRGMKADTGLGKNTGMKFKNPLR